MITLTIQVPDNEKEFIIKLLKKVNVKVVNSDKSPYDPEFVMMVKKSAASKNRTQINPEKLWESI